MIRFCDRGKNLHRVSAGATCTCIGITTIIKERGTMARAGNSSLHDAKKNKNDEFYTQLVDIEEELKHYREHFKGKTILCNCDDPYESNFFKYFAMNFNFLGLKRLITTCYDTSPVAGTQLSLFDDPQEIKDKKTAYLVDIKKMDDFNGDGAIDDEDVRLLLKKKGTVKKLKGNGDFQSPECIEYLKQADIVVTNPPFSLFRDYVAQLIEYQKQFIIIGNQNAVTYKEIFPLIMNNKIWWSGGNCLRWFLIPDKCTNRKYKLDNQGNKISEGDRSRWYTNLDIPARHEELILYKHYTPEEFPKYDNYDAINVDKTSDIPMDYDGIMGVPITFLDKYNPDQFEILGLDRYTIPKEFLVGGRAALNGKPLYARILIRRKHHEN